MCSFITINKDLEGQSINNANKYSKFRGPDRTNIRRLKGHTFIHNLLSITGEMTDQPFVSDDENIVCVYNGEIYNSSDYGKYSSDGMCLIDAYKRHGLKFIQHLDGEFAVVLYDFKKKIVVAGCDTFATKPLWAGLTPTGDLAFASYRSSLEALSANRNQRLDANKGYIFDFYGNIIKQYNVVEFDIHNQHKENYDDWMTALSESIDKRAASVRESIFLGLSSGYDSGVIASELKRQGISFKAYSIYAQENRDVLLARHKLFHDGVLIDLERKQYDESKDILKATCEESIYDTKSWKGYMTDDKAAVGLHYICGLAKKDSRKIYMSGQGADEIFADYGFAGSKMSSQSGLFGVFPEDLSTCFPWRNFYHGTQRAYLSKEENVAGSQGIEARYPFLDKKVVQEFLWLSPSLKNKNYKAPLYEYLTNHNIPFDKEKKVGFSCEPKSKGTS